MKPNLQRHPRGFTLIELLTVIAIIGILAAVIIPVVGKVRSTAKAASCISNLRQIGVAMALYAESNKQYLPNKINIPATSSWWVSTWQWQLQPYLESKKAVDHEGGKSSVFTGVFNCPGKTNYDLAGPTDVERLSYGMNFFSDGGSTATARKITSFQNPTRVVLVTDTNSGAFYLRNYDTLYNVASSVALWHNNKDNMLFADGHVEALPTRGVNYYLVKSSNTNERP